MNFSLMLPDPEHKQRVDLGGVCVYKQLEYDIVLAQEHVTS